MQQPLEVLPYYDPGVDPSTVAVVWFENVMGEPEPVHSQVGDLVEIEAERAARVDDGQWTSRSRYPGWTGDGYLQAHNAMGPVFDETLPESDRTSLVIAADRFPAVHHTVELDGGTYVLWVRRWVPSRWGYGLGGTKSDSVWLSVDTGVSRVLDDAGPPFDSWAWQRLGPPLTLGPGTHDLALRVRDRGYAIDRIVLSADPSFVPG